MPITRDWDGKSYDKVSGPQQRWGKDVLARLELRGDETVLDAGCGTGRVTQLLLDRLPEGRVIGVDDSARMLDVARENLGTDVELVHTDLAALDLQGRTVDHVVSTATFHWVPDHDALFAALKAVLRPGGRLVAQCGGFGNVESVHQAARDTGRLPGWAGPWNFQTAEATQERLERAGWKDVRCWLHDEPTTPEHPREFVETVILGAHLEKLPAEDHRAFVDEVMHRIGEPVIIDYVRLNIEATA